jgi:hypothetical protein
MRDDTTPRGGRAVRWSRRGRQESSEQYISGYEFPRSVSRKVGREHPELDAAALAAIETGLREWLTCCVYREGDQLGMPSQAVDWAWHQFILHTPAYIRFCEVAYGEYLHHVPESDMSVPMRTGLWDTVRAWDRSLAGRRGEEPSLWDLDERLGIAEPIGIPTAEVRYARHADHDPPGGGRRRNSSRDRWLGASYAGGGGGGDGGCSGGGGCGGGGGGGGCGGGGG